MIKDEVFMENNPYSDKPLDEAPCDKKPLEETLRDSTPLEEPPCDNTSLEEHPYDGKTPPDKAFREKVTRHALLHYINDHMLERGSITPQEHASLRVDIDRKYGFQ